MSWVLRHKTILCPGSSDTKPFCVLGPPTQNHFALDLDRMMHTPCAILLSKTYIIKKVRSLMRTKHKKPFHSSRLIGSSDDAKSFCVGRGPASIKNGRKDFLRLVLIKDFVLHSPRFTRSSDDARSDRSTNAKLFCIRGPDTFCVLGGPGKSFFHFAFCVTQLVADPGPSPVGA